MVPRTWRPSLGADVIIRIEPGGIRVWDYADEFFAG